MTVYPVGPGTVVGVTGDDTSGRQIAIDHGDGSVSTYSGIVVPRVEPGDPVGPDTSLGATGEAPLQWTVTRDGAPVDAATLIERARRPEGVADLLDRIDRQAAAEGWAPERTERAKGEVQARTTRDARLLKGRQDQATDAALEASEQLGQGFTSLGQLPLAAVADLAPDVAGRLGEMAQANTQGIEAQPDGQAAQALNMLAFEDRRRFRDTDLRLYRHDLAPDDYAALKKLQADAGNNPAAFATHDAIWSKIQRGMSSAAIDPSAGDMPAW